MRSILISVLLIFSSISFAEDVALTVEKYDSERRTTSIGLLDSSQVPLGTVLRIHSKTGTCEVRITERVNNRLIGTTQGCDNNVIRPGMKLAYSPQTDWPTTTPQVSMRDDTPSDFMQTLRERVTVFVGHNFARQLEGNVFADGSARNLQGETAFSMGVNADVYDFTPRVRLNVGLGYETARTLDHGTFVETDGSTTKRGTLGYSPRLALWSLTANAQADIMDDLVGFGGLNISIPLLSNSPFSMDGDIGFQAGANYQLLPQVAIEGLIKISNMNLQNNIGETTDVSLAGLEVRGRYSF